MRSRSLPHRCSAASCPRQVFAERLPGLVEPHARATVPLTAAHRDLGLALGGEAGARLAATLGVPTSPDTLLRRVIAAAVTPVPPPRYVGVDDWAIRKGQRYGTIVIDHDRGRVIDLTPAGARELGFSGLTHVALTIEELAPPKPVKVNTRKQQRSAARKAEQKLSAL